jgi:hypothetical protein
MYLRSVSTPDKNLEPEFPQFLGSACMALIGRQLEVLLGFSFAFAHPGAVTVAYACTITVMTEFHAKLNK